MALRPHAVFRPRGIDVNNPKQVNIFRTDFILVRDKNCIKQPAHASHRGIIYHVPPRTENKRVSRRNVIHHVPPPSVKTHNRSHDMKCTQRSRRNMINHAPTIYMNKFNKRAVLTRHTADICRRVARWWQKTLFWSITHKILVISVINEFNTYKNTNQLQELSFLDAKTYVSYRWNRRFLHQEPPFFERKSME